MAAESPRWKRSVIALGLGLLLGLWLLPGSPLWAQDQAIKLVVRGDDMGMTHSANEAFELAFNRGIITSGGLIVPSPWFEDAVRRSLEHPDWSVGIHLCVNAEWKNYRWRPVLPYNLVSSLVDKDGFFYPSAQAFLAAGPKLDEIEKELRAQIDRALACGLKPDYLDTHMDSLESKEEYLTIVRKLAKEYNLPVSGWCGEDREFFDIYNVAPEEKEKVLIEKLKSAKPGLYLLVVHPGLDTPEERALIDQNPDGLKNVYRYRSAEVRAITSPKVKKVINKRKIKLVSYRELKAERRAALN
ncbi:MAG: polysaccharide deacetylase family protein [Candidatus Aminicenantales bacterium]|nr:ChbG/HpnK family deacetylase [Acidobacteriota bacterium]